jgi:hypothetical protein
MNNQYIFLVRIALTFIPFLCFEPIASAQQIPNAGFESWSGGEPDSWNTTNMSVLFTPFLTVNQETNNPQSGTSCAMLETVTKNIFLVGQVTIPGVLTLGVLNIDPVNQTASISGGIPFTGRPQALSGYIKYQPSSGDMCLLGLGLTKWNNGVRDTIGFSFLPFGISTSEWMGFTVPLLYLIQETPDTLNIGLISSNIADGLAHTGSKLWVDNLSLTYGNISIEGITFPSDIKIFADGSKHRLIIKPDFEKLKNAELTIYNMNGQVLFHQSNSLQQQEVSIDLSSLLPGTYVFRADIPGREPVIHKFSILF